MSTETNESILTKGVVSIDDRKLMGKVKDLIIDCDACGVSHYIVSSSSTNTALVLPFDKSLAVGDTFMTIQSRADFLPTTDLTARGALDDNFDLVGLDVYSRAGNRLGVIKGFDIDTAFGAVTKIELEDGQAFEHDAFVFFAPEFVFVDDGATIDADLRASEQAASDDQEADAAPLAEPAGVEDVAPEEAAQADEDAEPEQEPVEAEDEAEPEEGPVEAEEPGNAESEQDSEEADDDDPDEELKSFLRGKKLAERVESPDGAFVAERGEELTDEVLADAQQHDALLLLTMSINE